MLGIGPFYCILTSALWAVSSIFATRSIRAIGAPLYNCLRLVCGGLLIGGIALVSGPLELPNTRDALLILGSSIIGLTLGDLLLFHGFAILGARRSTLLFMMNIPFTAALGFVILGETLTGRQLLGIFVGLLGISGATLMTSSQREATARIARGSLPEESSKPESQRRSERARVDDIQGSSWKGILACLGAALCQSCGLLLLKPALAEGRYPVPQVAMMRFLAAGILALILYLQTLPPEAKTKGRLNFVRSQLKLISGPTAVHTAVAVLLGGVIGFIFYVAGISKTPASLAALYTSLSPVFVLPLLTFYTKKSPPLAAWAGALIGVAGVYLCLVP